MKMNTNKLTMILALMGLGVTSLGILAFAQEEHRGRERQEVTTKSSDIEKLYQLVQQARADLGALRERAGIRSEGERVRSGEHAEGGRERRSEGRRERRGEHEEGRRERRGEHEEGRGESEGGEEGGTRVGKNEKWDQTRNGARLIIAYNAATQSFKGTVANTTTRTLSQVRVEVHLSNGVELGPTKRIDLKPGAKMAVELSAADQEFSWWTTHPEHGSEEGHGAEGEGREGRGEHGEGRREGGGEHSEGSREHRGEGAGNRPNDPALRPLYNQLQLLRNEIRTLSRSLRGGGGRL